jgi:arsenite transporter
MGIFERFLSLWVALAIVAGVALGALFPGAAAAIEALQVARINLPIALLIWGMIYPMMLAVDFSAIAGFRRQPKGLIVTVAVNWLIKPLTMTAIAWLFIRGLFGAWIPAELGDQYIAGMILLGVAPCTAMVFVWSRLSDGDPNYTLVQVAINDLIMVFAFAPIAAVLLGVSQVLVPWDTLVTAVGLFVVVPLAAGLFTRALLRSPGRIERLEQRLKPLAIVSLIATVLLLFWCRLARSWPTPWRSC